MYGADQNRQAMADANAANRAMNAQDLALSREGLAQQKEQFGQTATIGAERALSKRDYAGGLLTPFSETGQQASGEQAALLGLGTPEEQSAAMSRFGDSPGQKFMRERAEKSLVRNAARLGGLGGGNVRSALVEQGVGFAAQDYDKQFGRLGTLADRGLVSGQTMSAADLGVSKTALGLNEANQAAKIAAAKVAAKAAATPSFKPSTFKGFSSSSFGPSGSGPSSGGGSYNMSGLSSGNSSINLTGGSNSNVGYA
jgi:hypothetical protein